MSSKIELIKQALGAAESSIKLAKQLLSEIENGKAVAEPNKEKAKELPGIAGIFDGENMVSETGENFPVPANYASKSLLVVGDTLKLVEEGKEKRFKQIEHVKRHKTLGILAKKDGKWKAVTPEGSYKVLPAAVAHFGGDVGSEVVLHLPATNLTVPWGAIESVKNKKPTADEVEKIETPNASAKVEKEEIKEVKKEEVKAKEVAKKEEKAKPVAKAPEKPLEKPKNPPAAKPAVKEAPELEAPKPVVVEQKPAVTASAPPTAQPAKSSVPAAAPAPAPAAAPQITEEDELT